MASAIDRPRVPFYSENAFLFWAVVVVGTSLIFILQPLYPDLIGPVSNVLPSAGAANMFASALLCWHRYGMKIKRRFDAVWFAFSLGTGLWLVAELTWATYYFVLHVAVPYPSLADVFYVGGYIPILVALGLYLSSFSIALSKKRLAGAVGAVLVAIALAMAYVLPLEFSKSVSPLNVITDLSYPILDLSLLTLTILCLAIFFGGRISKWWVFFGAAATLYVIGDEYFLYQIAAGTYYNGSFDDLLFILGYLTFALAFYSHRREF